MSKEIKNLITGTQNPELIKAAFEIAEKDYLENKQIFGKNYIQHILSVALFLKEMGLDSITIAAGILHDVLDDLPSSVKKIVATEIEKRLGQEVAFLVQRSAEVDSINFALSHGFEQKKTINEEKIENLKRMLFAQARDLRVILIELASRLDNLKHLNYLKKEEQEIYSMEILKIFVPVAERLGVWEIKSQLEDLSFAILFPDKLTWLKNNIEGQYEARKKYLSHFTKHIEKILDKERISVLNIKWRPKTYWSTYRKLTRHNMEIKQIHDLMALKIVVPSISDCYKAMGVINKYFQPFEEETKDYIAKPKPNGYRSLHTTILSDDGEITEIQIKTEEMNREAEFGICAHWAYKEKTNLANNQEKLNLAKEIPTFWKTFKIEFYENRVFALTPRGDVINLPKGSTPIDFAYAVHSDIGNHCDSAKINGELTNLSQALKNGDVVEIVINKNRKPSADWLKIVKSSLAISQIKKEMAKNGIYSKIASITKIPSYLGKKVFQFSGELVRKIKPKKEVGQQIFIAGQQGIMVHIAKCCNPKPGDQTKGYISKYRSIVLHKIDCPEFKKLAKRFPEKVFEAEWR